MSRLRLRPARPADAAAIARLQIVAWRESYAHLLPEASFDAFDAEKHIERWGHYVARVAEKPMEAVFVAQRVDDRALVGFGSCGPQRSDRLRESGFAGEIWAIYLLRAAQGQGLGRALMSVMARHLAARGLAGLSVWVFRDNPAARGFYEALGGGATGLDGHYEFLGANLPDLAYGWRDGAALAPRKPHQ